MQRNGADFAVYINTGQEVSHILTRFSIEPPVLERPTTLAVADHQYDGSDSGARPDEAVSWGKIRAGAESVKVGPLHQSSRHALESTTDSQVYADATLVFPLIVAATFGKAHWAAEAKEKATAAQEE